MQWIQYLLGRNSYFFSLFSILEGGKELEFLCIPSALGLDLSQRSEMLFLVRGQLHCCACVGRCLCTLDV